VPVSAVTGEVRESQRVGARRWDRVRHVLIVGWLLILVATPLVGERTATWGELRALVAAGEVDAVRISGELPYRANGYSVVEIHWRHGWQRHTAEVVQVSGRGQRPEAEAAADGDAPVIQAAPSSRLTALQAGLQVTRDQRRSDGGGLLGWHVPYALTSSAFVLFVASFVLLVAGPQPWRATRWAWFWLLLPPVGSIAFLVLSGPTPGVPRPRDERRRLTGGWAFLLAIPLRAALESYRW
jgi:hypothetical protein